MFRIAAVEKGVTQFTMARRIFGRDLYQVAAYHVGGLAVDTGMAHLAGTFIKHLRGFPVTLVVNTHAHEDHIGANAPLQAERNVPILAHPLAVPVIADPVRLALRPYQRFLFGYPRPSRAEPIPDKVWADGHEFRVLSLPGHSPDHIGLLDEEQGWLFCGDAYIGGRERVLRADYDVWEMIGSLERLRGLPLSALFCGSGSVVRDPAHRIGRKLAYLLETAGRVWDLRRAGLPDTEIAQRIFPADWVVRFVTCGHFAADHLVRSFLSRPPR
jgi:glyoxylase-like metal-dependent hydrolase (beta-lactamase superfamily II)